MAVLQGGHTCKPFVALFRAPGMGGHGRCHVLLSRSTRGMRTSMNNQHDLSFSMPLAQRRGADKQAEQLAEELVSLATVCTQLDLGFCLMKQMQCGMGKQPLHGTASWHTT